MKKILITLAILFGSFYTVGDVAFAEGDLPTLNCYGLPGCDDSAPDNPTVGSKEKLATGENVLFKMLGNIISTLIDYVAVVSVIAIILSGFMMLLSGGDEEKVNRAKKWITYSLIGVFVSMASYGIITVIDNLEIGINSVQSE